MRRAAKLPAKKSPSPKTLLAVASQQLFLINGILDEVARNYVARLRREISELSRCLEKSQAGPRPKSRKELQQILRLIGDLQINPEKGRRKDLKKIDALIGEIQSIIERP